MSITWEVRQITPDDAAEMLGRMYRLQRRVRVDHVARLAADMREGRFILTPDPIVVLEDGMLANGQHRLRAVIESDCAIESVVSHGWPEKAFLVMDGGKTRSYTDRVFQPWLRSHCVASAVNAAISGGTLRARLKSLSDFQRTAFALQYEAHILAVMSMKGASSLRAQVCAGCIRAVICGADHGAIARFVSIVASGVGETPSDSAAVRLFAFLNSAEIKSSGQRPDIYKKTTTALRAFLDGKPLAKLQLTTVDVYPLPSDEVTT